MIQRPILTNSTANHFSFSESGNQKKSLFLSSPKILLVEDNRSIQFVLRTNLTEFGCEVHVAQDGLEAMSMFKNGYALILLDIQMPRMNGIEVAKEIRKYEKSHPNVRNTLIASTAFGALAFDQCKEAGFDDCYGKPVLHKDLIAMLEKWLPQY